MHFLYDLPFTYHVPGQVPYRHAAWGLTEGLQLTACNVHACLKQSSDMGGCSSSPKVLVL